PLTVYGDGSQTRSFCYVADLVRGLYGLLMSGEHQPVNIGNPTEMSILEFAHTVLDATGSQSEITFVQPTDERIVDDPKIRRPDITRARELLDWEPTFDLREGLRHTIAYFKELV
ncbi:MAG: GDP-mannose 4,6-dehydratase, partial [Anaerolineales bacterium]|nr:GDP-mannose 4,6-dehydratase [Anaerolineales bacterium]